METDQLNVLIFGTDTGVVKNINRLADNYASWKLQLRHLTVFSKVIEYCHSDRADLVIFICGENCTWDLEQIKSLRKDCDKAILVISSKYDDMLSASFIKVGADDYLRADLLDEKALSNSINYCLEQSHLRRIVKKAQLEDRHLAYHDSLTNLPNRKLFIDRLNQAINQNLRSGKYVAVIYLDLDEFKDVNDTLGHKVGDLLLKSVAGRLKRTIRKSDTVARIGGDEYVVILNGINGPRDAATVARKIKYEIGKPHKLDMHNINVSASIGISIFPWDGDTVDSLLRNADKAMYLAKEYRSGYQFFHRTMNEQVEAKIRLEKNLLKALENDELILHFHPILSTRTNMIHALEVLLRWNHPEVGTMFPIDFMPVAEESELMRKIDGWVIRKSIDYLHRLDGNGKQLNLALNISTLFNKKNIFRRWIDYNLGVFKDYPERFILEISEPSASDNLDDLVIFLKQARESGLKISLENFGRGVSSLSLLDRLPIDSVKIDKSLLKHESLANGGMKMLEALVGFAHHLDLEFIASGIENSDQDKFVNKLKCDYKQGYYYSHPVPEDEIIGFIGKMVKGKKDFISLAE